MEGGGEGRTNFSMSSGSTFNWFVERFNSLIEVHVPISARDPHSKKTGRLTEGQGGQVVLLQIQFCQPRGPGEDSNGDLVDLVVFQIDRLGTGELLWPALGETGQLISGQVDRLQFRETRQHVILKRGGGSVNCFESSWGCRYSNPIGKGQYK